MRINASDDILSCKYASTRSTAVLVWKCLNDAAPRYLADLCVPAHSVHGRQQLRSTASGSLLVQRSRTVATSCGVLLSPDVAVPSVPPER